MGTKKKTRMKKKPTASSKRKAAAPRGRGRPSKKSKAGGASQPRTYLLMSKCRETGEGEIYPTEEEGTIKFKDAKLASFTGIADFHCVGRGAPFAARKITDSPAGPQNLWADFSEKACARASRW